MARGRDHIVARAAAAARWLQGEEEGVVVVGRGGVGAGREVVGTSKQGAEAVRTARGRATAWAEWLRAPLLLLRPGWLVLGAGGGVRGCGWWEMILVGRYTTPAAGTGASDNN